MISLNTKLTKGKYKGKSILEIAPNINWNNSSLVKSDWNYVAWILNNWKAIFFKEVHDRHDWDAHVLTTGFGSGGGITKEDCEKNLI